MATNHHPPGSRPPYGTPLPPPRRRFLPWLVGGAVLVALCCAGGAVMLTLDVGDPAPSPAGADRRDPDTTHDAGTAGIGDPVRDGMFEFTVTGVDTGVARVGDEVPGEQAQGQFVLVQVRVENIGEEAQYFAGSAQTLVDTDGREHSADEAAALFIEGSDSLFTEINPGNAVDGVVVFDIPTDAVPAVLELHDSLLSGGVTVDLGAG